MQDSPLKKLIQFENDVKKCILTNFGEVLPSNKKDFLLSTEFIMLDDFIDLRTREEIQGKILHIILDSIIDITCLKELSIAGENTITVVYGRDLEESIINYYEDEFAKKFNFSIKYKEYDEELVTPLLNEFKDGFDYKVFNEDAIKILSINNLKNVLYKCDVFAINEYENKDRNKNNSKQSLKNNDVQLILLDNKKYIKYINKNGELKLTIVNNDKEVTDYYKQRLANLKPNEILDSEDFYNELLKIAEIEEFINTEEKIDNENLKPINFIEDNHKKSILNDSKTDDIDKIETGENIKPNDSSNDGNSNIEESDYSKYSNSKDSVNNFSDVDNDNKILSKEQYEELCMKYVNNEELSDNEIKALLHSTPELMNEKEINDFIEKHPKVKKINYKNNNLGFTRSNTLIYFIFLAIFIGIIIGALLFKLTI